MKDKQLLVKRDVKEGLPKETGEYLIITELGRLTRSMFDKKNQEFQFSSVTHWYEPATLLSLLEELKLEGVPDSKHVPHYHQCDSNEVGAEWMKQKLLPLLAAKDLEIERLLKEEKKLVKMYSEIGIDLKNADKEIAKLKAEIEKYHNGTIIEKK